MYVYFHLIPFQNNTLKDILLFYFLGYGSDLKLDLLTFLGSGLVGFVKNRLLTCGWMCDADDVDLVKDMPITVQIVGGRFGEEKAVAVAKVLKEVL